MRWMCESVINYPLGILFDFGMRFVDRISSIAAKLYVITNIPSDFPPVNESYFVYKLYNNDRA